jgi:hypothetical protein
MRFRSFEKTTRLLLANAHSQQRPQDKVTQPPFHVRISKSQFSRIQGGTAGAAAGAGASTALVASVLGASDGA